MFRFLLRHSRKPHNTAVSGKYDHPKPGKLRFPTILPTRRKAPHCGGLWPGGVAHEHLPLSCYKIEPGFGAKIGCRFGQPASIPPGGQGAFSLSRRRTQRRTGASQRRFLVPHIPRLPVLSDALGQADPDDVDYYQIQPIYQDRTGMRSGCLRCNCFRVCLLLTKENPHATVLLTKKPIEG